MVQNRAYCWIAMDALGQDKQRANTTNNGNLLCPLLPVRLPKGLLAA